MKTNTDFIVIWKGRGVFPVKKDLRTLAKEREFFTLQPDTCVLHACPGGTVGQLDLDCTNREDFARILSIQAKGTVLFCYIYDGDFWGYYLYNDGAEQDRFSPIPDYFGFVGEAEVQRCAGNLRLLAETFDVSEESLRPYLHRWTETAPNPVTELGSFLSAIGFSATKEKEETITYQRKEQEQTQPPIPAGTVPQQTNGIFHFQVNLGGMLDVLSNHLYKSPDVFLRELLQNGVDAVTLRQKEQLGWSSGYIAISLEPGHRMIFQDNGAGLSEEGIHRFLAVIGQSSKTKLVNGQIPEDYIGRFGIGLLSCFMVSDSIIVHTRPAEGGTAHIWTGYPDGTYTLERLEDCPVGTTVILTAKPGMEEYFQKEKVEELVLYYGLALPVPIYVDGNPDYINNIPDDFSIISRSQLLNFGEWLFDEEFIDAIPIHTPHITGVAYVLSYRTDAAVKMEHRIYLKQMLLTECGDKLLPSWAFFLRCFLNTNGLRPTASREDFYEDDALEEAQTEFAMAVRDYLSETAAYDPERLQYIVNIHSQAIKALAVWDSELFHLFIDYLSFETSDGTMTGVALKKAGEACWISSVSRFKQLRPLFMAQNRLLICTGYTSDAELVQKLARNYHLPLTPLQEESMERVLEPVTEAEQAQGMALVQKANRALKDFDCRAQLRRFQPADMPVLYSQSDEVEFLRHVQSAKETGKGIFSGALSSLLDSVEEKTLANLYLNLNSPLIRHLITSPNTEMLESVIKILYVQSLLAEGQSLRSGELKVLNQELLRLVDHSL